MRPRWYITCLSPSCLSHLSSIKPFSQQTYAMQASGPAHITGGCSFTVVCWQRAILLSQCWDSLADIKEFAKAQRNNSLYFVCDFFYLTFTYAGYESTAGLSMSPGAPPWQGRSIASSKLRMLEFSAFLEQPQDPETVSGEDRRFSFYKKNPKKLHLGLIDGYFKSSSFYYTQSS